MRRPNITPGNWEYQTGVVWAGHVGCSALVDIDDSMPSEATDADGKMMAAAPDMFDALNCMLAEIRGRGIHLDNATRAIQAMHKAGGQFHEGGRA